VIRDARDAQLAGLLRRSADDGTAQFSLDDLLPVLLEFSGARAVLATGPEGQTEISARRSDVVTDLDAADLAIDAEAEGPLHWGSAELPAAWIAAGISRLAVQHRPDGPGFLVVAWDDQPDEARVAWLQMVLAYLGEHFARYRAETQLADLTARVDNAQRLANMGDYDWHVASDTNRWSDQLYRIYGHEPQSFNASYDRFLSHIHPDDRQRIQDIHRHAFETGEPYEMVERVVRPDGTVRFLSSNGQVVQDKSGAPVRMRGTCIDITDRILAEQARERLAARFRSLVESCPDAILVLDVPGTIVQANRVAHDLLGGQPVGTPAMEISAGLRTAGHDVKARALDGRSLELDVTVCDLHDVEGEGLVAVYLRDASVRHTDEARAAALREAQVRHRQAQEINDDVIQGLTAAILAMEQGAQEAATSYLEQTLTAARHLMNDWSADSTDAGMRPGSLVRGRPSALPARTSLVAPNALPPHSVHKFADPDSRPVVAEPTRRILVVDDNDDVRTLLSAQIDFLGKGTVVGQAASGAEGVRLAAELQPNLVFLDLSMPGMDGLEALPLILKAVPDVKVVVMSGFDGRSIAQQVLASGAARYVEKGLRMNLAAVIDEIYAAA
jgi:PAS domain S-box-containing protein